MIGRCTDEAIAASVVPTLRAVHEAGADDWARTTIAQLAGLLRYAEQRGDDPEPRRRAELAAALGVDDVVDASPYERAAELLVAADGGDEAAARRRDTVRAVLVAQLDDELAETMCLLDAFRGRFPDA
ncbi:hypothetical protein [Desertimonas flava]|jgi:hypothetical protein|uniref:hypothetical protein n=1 Tax=Desertimonas flava TaxID=2064846 RepID=UPI0013C4DB20|nr:hypothetical protein [Desertimonas flava]